MFPLYTSAGTRLNNVSLHHKLLWCGLKSSHPVFLRMQTPCLRLRIFEWLKTRRGEKTHQKLEDAAARSRVGLEGGREQGGVLTERGVHCLFFRLTVCVTDAPTLSSAGKRQRWWFVEMPKTTYNYVYLTGDLLGSYEFWLLCCTKREEVKS